MVGTRSARSRDPSALPTLRRAESRCSGLLHVPMAMLGAATITSVTTQHGVLMHLLIRKDLRRLQVVFQMRIPQFGLRGANFAGRDFQSV